ncbi:MAG TPA: polysaccharide deacetylase family protein [Candidatus Saccharimonadales bacterium]|nr:polysaccharide deacetylase family protein [Candidatus Saccharimonadales bacterium]
MKRIKLYLAACAVLIGTAAATILPALAAETNLIANTSVETAETTSTPANWHQSRWGNNTAELHYKTPGKTGDRSLYVSMSSHTDGDAKWMHDAVAVKPNTSYTYTSAYKANVATEIDLQYTDTSGNVSYAYVDTIAPSTEWGRVSVDFLTPANVAKVTVMHIVATPGWLQTDDFTLTTTTPESHDDHDHNAIINSSFEVEKAGVPAAWYTNSWGENTAKFSYENTGRTGTRSAKVTITDYKSGDAKWFAETSAVTPGKNYLYRDYYKSNVPTRVVAAFVDANNNYSYHELAGASASATDWKLYSTTFTAPDTAVKVSIYHVVDRVGSLTLDDTSLDIALPSGPTDPVVTPPAEQAIPIPNASLETANGAVPANWQKSSWGTNNATHQYVNEGHTGTKSAKITMSNYVSGDAKWYFDPIKSLKAGQQYRFTTWYKSNVTPHAVAMFTMADGSAKYFGMPITQPSGSSSQWQKYTDTFTVPAGAVSTSVFLFINQNGWLQTDDYSLTTYQPRGFERPLLTMTFDDGHEDNATNALPLLNQYGLKTTQCYASSFIEGRSQQIIDGVLAFQNSGHEICSHTVSHPFLTSLNSSSLTYELQHSKQYLEKLIGEPVVNFASPYGDYNATVVNELKKYYKSHRSVDEGYNSKDNFDAYNLRVQNVLDTTSAQQVSAWIKKAQAENTWLILVYHRVADNPGPYDSYKDVFAEHVRTISDSGITVKTYNDALNEVTDQL